MYLTVYAVWKHYVRFRFETHTTLCDVQIAERVTALARDAGTVRIDGQRGVREQPLEARIIYPTHISHPAKRPLAASHCIIYRAVFLTRDTCTAESAVSNSNCDRFVLSFEYIEVNLTDLRHNRIYFHVV